LKNGLENRTVWIASQKKESQQNKKTKELRKKELKEAAKNKKQKKVRV